MNPKEQTITISVPLGEIEITVKEIEEMYRQRQFLEDVALVISNPEATEKCYDIPYNHDSAKALLKDYFLKETEYESDFIEQVFGEVKDVYESYGVHTK